LFANHKVSPFLQDKPESGRHTMHYVVWRLAASIMTSNASAFLLEMMATFRSNEYSNKDSGASILSIEGSLRVRVYALNAGPPVKPPY
jgi:hypothetical protein